MTACTECSTGLNVVMTPGPQYGRGVDVITTRSNERDITE